MQATIYTLETAAEILLLHEETLRRAYRRGALKAAMVGRRLRVSKTELERYWASLGGGEFWDRPEGKAVPKKKKRANAKRSK